MTPIYSVQFHVSAAHAHRYGTLVDNRKNTFYKVSKVLSKLSLADAFTLWHSIQFTVVSVADIGPNFPFLGSMKYIYLYAKPTYHVSIETENPPSVHP